MQTKIRLLAAGFFLAVIGVGFGQPVITTQPQSQTNAVRTTATFWVVATGTPPLAYQWQKLGSEWTDLAGCTDTNLVLTNVQTSDAADYQVVVTTAQGAVTSVVAHLYVILQPTLQFAAATYTVAENAGAVTLTVQRRNDPSAAVTVDYTTTNGSATAGLKYTTKSGTLSFGPGKTNQTIVVPILNEGFVEAIQTFRVVLSNPAGGAVLGTRTSATVGITDNDVGIDFQFSSYTVADDAGQVLIGVVQGDDGTLPVTVDFATTDLSATNGLDYIGASGALSFAPQERLKFIPIPILNNCLKQPRSVFDLQCSKPSPRRSCSWPPPPIPWPACATWTRTEC